MKFFILVVFSLPTLCFAENNLDRAESLVLQTRYDEALVLLDEGDTPRYYYNKLICEYSLFKTDDGIKSATKLLSFDNLPRRYLDIGRLIQYELENLKPDSIDHVASLMRDSQRRLNLGHGGSNVQRVQSETIAILDYLIEKIEQQQGGGQASENCPGEQGSSSQSNQHAKDSTVKGQKAPGEVDPKQVGKSGAWGSLPPKEQAKARQHAEENYPPHYRKIIEEYNRQMAERKRIE
jgi:hypothetical protein